MIIGDKDMKLLKIENSLGYYLDDQNNFETIDKINKEALLRLLNLTLENEVEFDDFIEENIQNQAHQIVYKSIFEKLNGVNLRKQKFTDESERLYLQEYERYRDDESQDV
jgi:hypothetical protein